MAENEFSRLETIQKKSENKQQIEKRKGREKKKENINCPS